MHSNSSMLTSVVQESPGEGVRWSVLSLQGIVLKDTGVYHCKAKNVAGSTEAAITLSLAEIDLTTSSPPFSRTFPATTKAAISFTSSSAAITSTTTSTSKPSLTSLQSLASQLNLGPGEGIQRSPPAGNPSKMEQSKNSTKDKGRKKGSSYITDVEVVEETGDSAVVLWLSEGLPSESPLSVVYFPYDAEESEEIMETEIGSGKILLENLFSNQMYTVCLVPRIGKEQCVTFSTLDVMGVGQNKWLLFFGGIACVFVLPLIVLLLYKISSLYWTRSSSGNAGMDDDLSKETYVKFETLAMQQRALNGQASDLWTRRLTQESERMLLFSRSSIDSQMTYKSDHSQCEYLC